VAISPPVPVIELLAPPHALRESASKTTEASVLTTCNCREGRDCCQKNGCEGALSAQPQQSGGKDLGALAGEQKRSSRDKYLRRDRLLSEKISS